MGMHMGTPDCKPNPITKRVDYHGPDVNKASRVLGVAKGGQIIISQRIYQWLASNADSHFKKSITFLQLGKFSLKGVKVRKTKTKGKKKRERKKKRKKEKRKKKKEKKKKRKKEKKKKRKKEKKSHLFVVVPPPPIR